MTEPVVVYWAPVSSYRYGMVNWLWGAPKPLWSTLPKQVAPRDIKPTPVSIRNGNYRACRAATNVYRDTYVFPHPITSEITFSGDITNPQLAGDKDWWLPRQSSLEGCYSADYDFNWVFFSEEDVYLYLTPPYMHRTTTQDYGVLASGAFNIHRWFRMINLGYHLWPGVDTLKVVEGEPVLYLDFITEDGRPVVLKQFHMDEKLLQIAAQTGEFKTWCPNASLENLYERFTEVETEKYVLKLIKENLIAP